MRITCKRQQYLRKHYVCYVLRDYGNVKISLGTRYFSIRIRFDINRIKKKKEQSVRNFIPT